MQNYEVLSILGADLNSTCYKVKHKMTSEIYVWKAVSYENFTESEKHSLISRIEKRKKTDHPNLLCIYDYILNEETKIMYLVCEFCANGNLSSIIQRCLIENEYLIEDFLWRTLYQIACALKITKVAFNKLSLNNIFLDSNYNVKLFNNELLSTQKTDDRNFGFVMYELCTLQPHRLNNAPFNESVKDVVSHIPKYYSKELKEIIKFTFNMNSERNAMIDAVLCHPTILLKSVGVQKNNIYVRNAVAVKNEEKDDKMVMENITNNEIEALYHTRLEHIKNRETALKIREEKLTGKAHELHKREKKIALMERVVKDKMLHAEVYLKRCREVKSTSSSSSNSKISYENIDTSFSADCGDSSINIPTSNKINSHFIKKPPGFTRTMSDRRIVRFKGHSPLKNVCNKNNSFKDCKQQKNISTINETISGTSSEECLQKKSKSRKKLDLFSLLPARNRKPLVDLNVQDNIIHEETEYDASDRQCDYRPVSWTEESKQQAFDLLRLMNQNEEIGTIKHTYL